MAIIASEIIFEVARRLNDTNNATRRWSETDLLSCLNNAQKMVAEAKPEASIKSEAIQLAAGFEQTLPEDGKRFLSLSYNAGTSGTTKGRAISQMQASLLDAIDPEWRSMAATDDVRYYAPDPDFPEKFEIFPPNTGSGYAHCRYESIPVKCTSATASVALKDEYREPLTQATIWYALADRTEDQAMRAIRKEALQYLQLTINIKEKQEEAAE